PRTEVNPIGIAPPGRCQRVDYGHAFEALAQKPHPPVDFVQAPLAIGVFGILGAIALSGGLGDGRGHARAFVVPQLVELIAQPLGALRGDVL
ncbi:MAG TPA: hypothetical protein VII35_15580, partial [Steroidobacteraceae bacterium]